MSKRNYSKLHTYVCTSVFPIFLVFPSIDFVSTTCSCKELRHSSDSQRVYPKLCGLPLMPWLSVIFFQSVLPTVLAQISSLLSLPMTCGCTTVRVEIEPVQSSSRLLVAGLNKSLVCKCVCVSPSPPCNSDNESTNYMTI